MRARCVRDDTMRDGQGGGQCLQTELREHGPADVVPHAEGADGPLDAAGTIPLFPPALRMRRAACLTEPWQPVHMLVRDRVMREKIQEILAPWSRPVAMPDSTQLVVDEVTRWLNCFEAEMEELEQGGQPNNPAYDEALGARLGPEYTLHDELGVRAAYLTQALGGKARPSPSYKALTR